MLGLILALTLAAPGPAPVLGPAPPDAVQRVVLLEQERLDPADRPFTRWLDLSDLPVGDRDRYRKYLDFAANSTSWRSEFGHVELVAGGLLLRLDLRAFAWDFPSRHARLKELEARGVNFGFANGEQRAKFLDPWEALADLDPFFVTGYYDHAGKYIRGWLDPAVTNAVRRQAYSKKPVLRASWVLPRLLNEKKFGGIYSDLLMIPPKEADFYKSLLIDIKRFEADSYLLRGGAVLGGGTDGVALHNRELQLLPSPYGPAGTGYVWRTFDTNVDARGNKSVLEAFRGTLKHDGRESIGTLPNSLSWYRLDDGNGNQAADVPPDIAQVKESPAGLPIRDTRVINGHGCMRCHTPNNGIYPFTDIVRRTFLRPEINLKAKHKDLAAALEDYYASNLGSIIERQRTEYAAALKAACDMTGSEAVGIVGVIEAYTADPVSPEQAARELGYPLDLAKLYYLAASLPHTVCGCSYPGNGIAAVLAADQPVRRAAFEQSVADIMRAIVYPWESPKPGEKVLRAK